jgi:hypothetical protein
MIGDRFAIERMAAERQAELAREVGEVAGNRNESAFGRAITWQARTIRLVGTVTLALAFLGSGR